MATIKFLDPRAAVNPKERPLVPGLDSLEGKVIGIIDNGQSNSTDMFKELSKLLQERLHVKEVVVQDQADAYARRAQADHGGNRKPV